MIVPGRTLIFVSLAIAALLVIVVVWPPIVWVALGIDFLLLLMFLFEARALAKTFVTIERRGWGRSQLGRLRDFVYVVENRGEQGVAVRIRQPWPDSFSPPAGESVVFVQPGEAVELVLSATPRVRGRISVPSTQIEVSLPSAWGLKRWNQNIGEKISVYPDLQRLLEYDALRHHRSLRHLGIHRHRMIGSGREFDQLREYVRDDDYRNIEWKATARRHRPITIVHQAERSQDLVLCIDASRLMGNPAGEETFLDKAADCCTLLAHIASEQGDRVGLLLFRETVLRFQRPRQGKGAVLRIIEELVDLEVQGVFPSYAAWADALQTQQKKRSMIFLFTDLNDPQLAADLVQVVPVVARRHVLVIVSMRDPLLDKVASGPAMNRNQVYQVLAARELADERAIRRRELHKAGVHVLDVDHPSLIISTVNSYLQIKSRQLV